MSHYDVNGNYIVCKELIHYYKYPKCQLTTPCGIFVHLKENIPVARQYYTIYQNRVTCEVCLNIIKKWIL